MGKREGRENRQTLEDEWLDGLGGLSGSSLYFVETGKLGI